MHHLVPQPGSQTTSQPALRPDTCPTTHPSPRTRAPLDASSATQKSAQNNIKKARGGRLRHMMRRSSEWVRGVAGGSGGN